MGKITEYRYLKLTIIIDCLFLVFAAQCTVHARGSL